MSGLAGFVDGFARGYGLRRQYTREDEEAKARAEQRAWVNEQRERQRREQAQDDEVDRALQNVPRTNDKWNSGYEWAAQNRAPMKDDEGNMMPGVTSTPRSYREVMSDQAAAVRGIGGRRGLAIATQLQQAVNADEDREAAKVERAEAAKDRERRRAAEDIQVRREKVIDAVRGAGMLARTNPAEAMKVLQGAYTAVPDGLQLVITKDGRMGRAGPDGKWVDEPVPITPETAMAAVNFASQYGDTRNWAARQGVEQRDRQLGQGDRQLGQGDTRLGQSQAQIDNDRWYKGELVRQGDARLGIAREMARARAGGAGKEDAAKFLDFDDETRVAHGRDGRPMFNVLPGGLRAPLGVTNEGFRREQAKAKQAGVEVRLGLNKDGDPVLGYIGKDGRAYSSLQEAAAAKK